MFAEFAPRAREKGWRSLIPIRAGEKRPAIGGWSIFNKKPPSDRQIAGWTGSHGNDGIGLAFGPDHVIGVDLDWTDPAIATLAWDITTTILGETPLVRIGRPPKKLALYRRDPGLVVEKFYGGFELFTRWGQCVLFGVHPDTGQHYHWLTDTPATLGPAELPLVTRDRIFALINALEQLDPKTTARHRARVYGQKKPGLTADILRALQDVEDAPAGAARILAATPVGRRHNTMVAAAMALAMRGYSDAAIRAALDGVFARVMFEVEWSSLEAELEAAIKWARENIGPDDATATAEMAPTLESIAGAWNRRWGR